MGSRTKKRKSVFFTVKDLFVGGVVTEVISKQTGGKKRFKYKVWGITV